MRIWDLASGEELKTIAKTTSGTGSSFTIDGKLVLTKAPDVELWDYESGTVKKVFQDVLDDWARMGSLQSSDYSPNGRFIAAAFYNRGLFVFDIEAGQSLQQPSWQDPGIEFCAFAPDGSTLFYAGPNAGATTVSLDSPGSTRPRTLFDRGERMKICRFSPDGTRLLTLRAPEGAEWDGATQIRPPMPEQMKLWSLPEYTLQGEIALSSSVVDCLFSPSGDHVVLLEAGRLRVVDANDGKDTLQFHSGLALVSIAVSPDGQRVAVGSDAGDVLLLKLENIPLQAPLATVWRSEFGETAFGCPLCRTWSEPSGAVLGAELNCPQCASGLRLAPFLINFEWRPVAAAWFSYSGSAVNPQMNPVSARF